MKIQFSHNAFVQLKPVVARIFNANSLHRSSVMNMADNGFDFTTQTRGKYSADVILQPLSQQVIREDRTSLDTSCCQSDGKVGSALYCRHLCCMYLYSRYLYYM